MKTRFLSTYLYHIHTNAEAVALDFCLVFVLVWFDFCFACMYALWFTIYVCKILLLIRLYINIMCTQVCICMYVCKGTRIELMQMKFVSFLDYYLHSILTLHISILLCLLSLKIFHNKSVYIRTIEIFFFTIEKLLRSKYKRILLTLFYKEIYIDRLFLFGFSVS